MKTFPSFAKIERKMKTDIKRVINGHGKVILQKRGMHMIFLLKIVYYKKRAEKVSVG